VGAGDTNFAISDRQSAKSHRAVSRLDQPQRSCSSLPGNCHFLKTRQARWERYWAVADQRHRDIRRRQSGNVVLGYDLNGDGIGGDQPWLTNPAVYGKSFDNARTNPATGNQYSMDNIPAHAFFPSIAVANAHNWPGTRNRLRGIVRPQYLPAGGQNNFDVASSRT